MTTETKKPPPSTLVIFGGTGDLTKRLLLPAVVNLARARLLPEKFAVLAVGRRDYSSEVFRAELTASVREIGSIDTKSPAWRWLAGRIDYLRADFDDPAAFRRLGEALETIARRRRTERNVLFYLATAPEAFPIIVENLGAAGLTDEKPGGWRRVVIEKPFGTDLESARALNRKVLGSLDERQVFRIDHYLGKETVQNIMMLRFSNGIFEPLWNRDHIDHVQISVAETVGVETRGKLYDKVGALRDMVPNHLFQVLALIAMEAPASFDADAVRTEKAKVLKAVRSYDCEGCLDNVARGQYRAGTIGRQAKPGYRVEPDVSPRSRTETYVAMKLLVDDWRWAGVPFYLRTGKRLAAKSSQVAIQFKQAPLALFRDLPGDHRMVRNFLVLQLQPDEGVSLQFGVKVPGPAMTVEEVSMDFAYRDRFAMPPSTGYETLIYDCMRGDATLFQRADFVESGWRVLQPMLDAWRDPRASGLAGYAAGSDGPKVADALLARDGRKWHKLA
jgi:glucose-6-phosphate 1-dehydrogenase